MVLLLVVVEILFKNIVCVLLGVCIGGCGVGIVDVDVVVIVVFNGIGFGLGIGMVL